MSVLFAIAGFFDAVTERAAALPNLSLKVADGTATLNVDSQEGHDELKPRAVNLLATAATSGNDFRRSRWQRAAMMDTDEIWRVELPEAYRSTSSATAFIAEVELADHAGRSFLVHTPVTVMTPNKTIDRQ